MNVDIFSKWNTGLVANGKREIVIFKSLLHDSCYNTVSIKALITQRQINYIKEKAQGIMLVSYI